MYPITLTKKLDDIEICGMRLDELEHPGFKYPWEIIEWARQSITQNLKLNPEPRKLSGLGQNHNSKLKTIEADDAPQSVLEGDMFVWCGANVRIDSFVVLNTEQGEIIIDEGVRVYPFSYIEGPCYIGAHTEIRPHAQIRKNTSIGHHCKIGGEVSGSIIQPYTNKAHYGFLGDSYIGSWVNLGAGTTTSNLKNTYGPVRVEYPLEKLQIITAKRDPVCGTNYHREAGSRLRDKLQIQKIDTGMQFLGCIMGDYVKTSINTSIYTGKIIGVYAQLFGNVRENVGSFVMDTYDGPKEFELEAAIRAQKRMFERRGINQTKEDAAFLKRVFDETKHERSEL
ncbi:MAG: hypothetical protein HY564_01575 [Candidatus Jacksonbacteria bacterium]|nr:hypothetical protein [Candidatus Jacksonbacteria bacterium]